ncbi:MAG: UDP-N-acetylmuramate dehydrogenase [bacterium]
MDDIEKDLKKNLGSELKNNVVLKDYVSLGVGGVADYYFEAKNIEDLILAVNTAYFNKIPYFILGGGYNILPSDSGFPGLVIKNNTSNIVFAGDSSEVIVDSGVNLGRLINLAAGRDLGGLEFLFGVPGTVGGSICGNAGAFNFEISDFVKSVTVLVPKNNEVAIVKHSASWLNFSYRNSRIKRDYAGEIFRPVILTAKLQLVQRRRDEILKMMQNNLKRKKDTQPMGEKSAGSFFKNPGPEKNAAGYYLEQVGAKKMQVGGAAFSKKHANFLINAKNATAADIKSLADQAKLAVKDKFDIDLREEVEYIGRW